MTTEQQRRRHEDEQRRLRNQRNLQRGSMAYYVNNHDDQVEAYQPSQDRCGSDSSSDTGGSCD